MVMAFATSLWIGMLGAACMLVGWIVLGMPGALWSWDARWRRSHGAAPVVQLPLTSRQRGIVGGLLILVGIGLNVIGVVGVFDSKTRARTELMYDTFTRSNDEPIPRDR